MQNETQNSIYTHHISTHIECIFIGKNMPSKYDYLNLNQITETKKYGNNITIYTSTGDCYDFTISK